MWDRPSRKLHHGQARSLREVVCTPEHPGLLPGEVGFNERDGVRNPHGRTSHLDAEAIDDLVTYLLTL